MRPKPFMLQHIETVKQAIGYHHPIVGVHMRRGERGREGHGNCLETYHM